MVGWKLFPPEQIVGVFRGFREGGLEFHAELVLPYRIQFQNIPMHGQFLLVQLETPDEAVLGRISALSAEGRLTSTSGEEFNIRSVREGRSVPEDLREQYLRYRVNMRVLGVLRVDGAELHFVPSHRRLPHVGSPIAFPPDAVLRHLAGHDGEGPPIGLLAFGEYVYGDRQTDGFAPEPWVQLKSPPVAVRFPVSSLVSRRSFVFARAGFGKSNLTKLLFSSLYEETPVVIKRGGHQVPVGTVIFDPDGEYFWPDDKGRPGLCDAPALRDKLVVFTQRTAPSPFYGSFVVSGVKLDIRKLRPADVIAIALPPDRQEQQNVRKLGQLAAGRWEELVGIIDQGRNQTDLKHIARLLDLDERTQEMEALAARANMTRIVTLLHDRQSRMLDFLIEALRAGKLCIVDVSQMRGAQSLVLSGLILRTIFDHNQQQFTEAESATIPTIAVIEEAQSVLVERGGTTEPFVTWVKEGRKYDLGAVLVTQQPGSIPNEILSQGDNWFIFHLLSAGDLVAVRQANAHFSDDLLSSLLNEPIPGHGVFWSSAGGKPYPLPLRVLSFETSCQVADPAYRGTAVETFASRLKAEFRRQVDEARTALERADGGSLGALDPMTGGSVRDEPPPEDGDGLDPLELFRRRALLAFEQDERLQGRLRGEGVPWGELNRFFAHQLPASLDERDQEAYRLVPRAMSELGERTGISWSTFKPDGSRTWVRWDDGP